MRRGRKCDITITREEWRHIRDEKAKLERSLKDVEDTRLRLMARKLHLRRRLANLWDDKANMAVKKLEAITQEEENLEQNAFPANTSIKLFSSSSAHDLQMSPYEWAVVDRMPADFWSSPEPQALVGEEVIFGQLEGT